MSYNSLLVDKCDVYSRSTVIGQYGDASDTYTILHSQIKCRSMHKQNQFGSFAGQVNAVAVHRLYVEVGYVLTTAMRVVLGGVTYQIIHADMKWDSQKEHHGVYEMTAIESPQTGA